MTIVTPHKQNSRHVDDIMQIWGDANELRTAANGEFIGKHGACYALHHSQVNVSPYNFFVLSDKGDSYFPSWLIINPKIIEKDKATSGHQKEGCMSYPFRESVRTSRYGRIKGFYQTKKMLGWGLRDHEQWLTGVAAQIFQHEFDHSKGKYIYDDK